MSSTAIESRYCARHGRLRRSPSGVRPLADTADLIGGRWYGDRLDLDSIPYNWN